MFFAKRFQQRLKCSCECLGSVKARHATSKERLESVWNEFCIQRVSVCIHRLSVPSIENISQCDHMKSHYVEKNNAG